MGGHQQGDSTNKDYRSRVVGREIKLDDRLDLFAATPPLESMKILMSWAAKQQRGRSPIRLATVDIKRAYVYAPVRREVFIKLPQEDEEEGMVGKLNLSLYGTRDAAQNWARTWGAMLTDIGFNRGRASTCIYTHKERNIKLTCHGDDFLIAAPMDQVKWLLERMKNKFDLKHHILGPEEECVKEV